MLWSLEFVFLGVAILSFGEDVAAETRHQLARAN